MDLHSERPGHAGLRPYFCARAASVHLFAEFSRAKYSFGEFLAERFHRTGARPACQYPARVSRAAWNRKTKRRALRNRDNRNTPCSRMWEELLRRRPLDAPRKF